MAQRISLVMGAPSSFTTRQSWVVGCCVERYNSSTFHAGKAKTVRRRYCIRSSSHSRQVNPNLLNVQTTKERIRILFNNVELSVSSYDTAWVAMVPSPNAPKSPCFPECLNWLKDNQLDDGSWGLVQSNSPILLKDALSSTLACIVALRRWNVGEDQINKGLCFIESNFDFATDKNQPSPIGFDIIFPGMLEYAKSLNLNLPFKQEELNVLLHERDLELSRCDLEQREMYLAYISERLSNSYDWNMVMKYKMKNGSILNSPSATAAALIHHQDVGCHAYLTSVLEKFGNAVPTVYPLDLYIRLSMVDTLERLGVTRHFSVEIQNVLDETYRYWLLRDEKIFMDVGTCDLAFQVLRNNGYEVSSDHLAEIREEGYESLEVYQQEFSLGEEKLASVDILKRKLSTASNNLSELTLQEVRVQWWKTLVGFPTNLVLERISTRRNIEQYIVDDARTLKTTYRSSNISNEDYLRLAVEDYNVCQSIYREELKGVERWAVEKSLNKLKFARQKAAYGYLIAVSTFPSPELSDARISCAKSTTVVTVIDDFFDVQGSMNELVNLTHAVEKWNVNIDTDCCSEEVRIILLAIKDIVKGTGDAAYRWQKRDITSHLIQTWLDMMKSMLTETIWARDGYVPTMHEYIENGSISFAVGPVVLPALYLLGPKLSEEIVQSSEYQNLYNLASIHGRLMNDIMSVKRDTDAGRLNIVSLHQNNHAISGIKEEEVIEEIKMFINNQERKMLHSVMKETGSIVPRDCKDAFWNTWNVVNLFYTTDDGFSGNSILDNVKEIIYEPVSHRLVHMNETEELLKSSPWKSNP